MIPWVPWKAPAFLTRDYVFLSLKPRCREKPTEGLKDSTQSLMHRATALLEALSSRGCHCATMGKQAGDSPWRPLRSKDGMPHGCPPWETGRDLKSKQVLWFYKLLQKIQLTGDATVRPWPSKLNYFSHSRSGEIGVSLAARLCGLSVQWYNRS